MNTIHPTAIIADDVIMGNNNHIGPYCHIEKNCKIGNGNTFRSSIILAKNTTIGNNNTFFQFCSIGDAPQDLKYQNEDTETNIGNNNIFREMSQVHRGTVQDKGITIIKDNSLFMANTHIAHDCIVGDNVIIANNSSLAGHVSLGNHVFISTAVGVHQYVRIGESAMVAGQCIVRMDIPPFCVVAPNDSLRLTGINKEKLKRQNYSTEDINTIKDIYRIIYRQGNVLADAIKKIEANYPNNSLSKKFLDLLKTSNRGICR